MSLAERIQPEDQRAWAGERGSAGFVRLRADVALIVLQGKLGDDAIPAWNEQFPWVVGDAGKVWLFIDAAEVTFPSTGLIGAGTDSIKALRPRLEQLHVLVGGSLIEMIAKTANLTLGGLMRITRDREQFEAVIQRALD